MGSVRTVCLAFAIVVAGVVAQTVDAGRARPRGVRVASVVSITDDDLTSMTYPYPPFIYFHPDGDVIALYGSPAVRRRIAVDGTTSAVLMPGFGYVNCLDTDGSAYSFSIQDGQSQFVRVGPDGIVTSAPIDPGGDGAGTAARDGRLYVLTQRSLPDRALWLQRFAPDGTPDSQAVRVTPPDGPAYYGVGTTVDVDADGSAYVLWQSATIDASFQSHDNAVNWQRVDADGSVSPPVRLFSSTYDPYAIYFWQHRLGPDGTMWVQPRLDGSTDAKGPIGIRRDGVVLPVIDLHSWYDATAQASGMAASGVDAAGEVRTLSLPSGIVDPAARHLRTWRPQWRRFRADATPMRTRRLAEPNRLRRRFGRSGIWLEQMEVAPDGSSLVTIIRALKGPDNFTVLEFIHLGPDGRVLSGGSFTPMPQMALPQVISTVVAGRPRFAMTWLGWTRTDGPLTAFVAILE